MKKISIILLLTLIFGLHASYLSEDEVQNLQKQNRELLSSRGGYYPKQAAANSELSLGDKYGREEYYK